MRWIVFLLTTLFLQSPFANDAATETADRRSLSVALMVNNQNEASSYDFAFNKFEQLNPNINLNIKYLPDQLYKENIAQWLNTGEFDLVYWQAGYNRLHDFVAQDLLLDMTELWEKEKLEINFIYNLKPLVTYNDKIIAIPFSYYHWGFFYNKVLFKELGISPPLTLDDLELSCELMSERGITPIGMGLKDPWPVLAWFTYITLRSQGLEFYSDLTKGRISWQDPRVVQVMEIWHDLLKKCKTTHDVASYDWRLPSRSLLRKQVGLTLSGSFIMQLFDHEHAKNLGYFSFPAISKEIPVAEIAPVEVWIVPKKSLNQDLSVNFIKLFLKVPSLTQFNQKSHYISPHKNSPEPSSPVMKQGVKVLQHASGLTPYFDREAPIEMVVMAEQVFTEFIESKNIVSTLNKLETLRLQMNRPQKPQ